MTCAHTPITTMRLVTRDLEVEVPSMDTFDPFAFAERSDTILIFSKEMLVGAVVDAAESLWPTQEAVCN